jgi:hypothetical protein
MHNFILPFNPRQQKESLWSRTLIAIRLKMLSDTEFTFHQMILLPYPSTTLYRVKILSFNVITVSTLTRYPIGMVAPWCVPFSFLLFLKTHDNVFLFENKFLKLQQKGNSDAVMLSHSIWLIISGQDYTFRVKVWVKITSNGWHCLIVATFSGRRFHP